MSSRHDLETALRALDAAEPHLHRGNALPGVERILAVDPAPAPPHQPRRPTTDRSRRPAQVRWTNRKAALAAATVAAVAGGVVVLPSLSGGDQAFASWTPNPQAVPTLEWQRASDGCRARQKDGAGADYATQLSAAVPVIAERRGVWTTVVLAGRDGFSAMCITDDSSPFFAKAMIGSVGTPGDYATPGPRDLAVTDLGSGTVSDGALSLAAGTAGAEVVALTYRSPVYGEVTATLSQGHFALWIPGTELEGAAASGITLDVTYRDGSTGRATLTL